MTTTDLRLLHDRSASVDRAQIGIHGYLFISEVPAGAEALVGKPLEGQTLTINGDYVCLIPIGGLASSLKVHVRCTLDSMTEISSGPDEVALFNPSAVNIADAVVITSATGDGSLSSGTLQTASLTITGAHYARYTLTIGSTPVSVIPTIAQYTGL